VGSVADPLRTRRAAATLLAALGVGVGAPAVALAQGSSPLGASGQTTSPFTPGLPQSTPTVATTTTTTPAVTTTDTGGDSGINGTGVLGIAIGALIILGGISFFIWRDARKRAPVRRAAAATAGADGRSRTSSKARGKPRKLSPAERKRRKRGRAK
jgi:hypothetical protein